MRANRTPVLAVIIGLLGLSPYARAQSGLPQPGERLRYWMRPCHGMSPVSPFCGTHSEGILLSFVPDSLHPDSIRLMLRREALGLSVPVRDMVRLEQRSGRRSAFWTGADYGGVEALRSCSSSPDCWRAHFRTGIFVACMIVSVGTENCWGAWRSSTPRRTLIVRFGSHRPRLRVLPR